MNCLWYNVTTPNENGWRRVKCLRCKIEAKSPYAFDRIYTVGGCGGWPLWHEFGEWVAIALGLVGITPSRWGWVRWKLGLQEPGGCSGCEARKLWLNSFGGKLASSEHWAAKMLARLLVRRVRR